MEEERLPESGDKVEIQTGDIKVEKGGFLNIAGRDIIQNIYTFIQGETEQQRAFRNRQKMLDLVWNTWIEGVYKESLHNEVLIELGMEVRQDVVDHPWDIVFKSDKNIDTKVPSGTPMLEVLSQAKGALLILGEPGSGKTTMLLELAKQSLELAQKDANQPIPVVLRLASWNGQDKERTLSRWLINELKERYYISERIAREWVESDELLLLLDGLDEVARDSRLKCADAINQFRAKYGSTSIVLTSRIEDFEELQIKLKMTGAIFLQPFSKSQVSDYFAKIGIKQEAVQKLFQTDEAFQELTKSPLMLNIIAMTYMHGPERLSKEPGSVKEQRGRLFNAYIEEMFDRRSIQQAYDRNKTKHWLSWLAYKMTKDSRISIFVPENIQPRMIDNPRQEMIYVNLYALVLAISTGLLAGIHYGAFWGGVAAVFAYILWGMGGSMVGWNASEVYSWSWEALNESLRSSWKLLLLVAIGTGVYEVFAITGLIGKEWKPIFLTAWFYRNVPSPYGVILYFMLGILANTIVYLLLFVAPSGITSRGRDPRDPKHKGYWRHLWVISIVSVIAGVWLGYHFRGLITGLLIGLIMLLLSARDYIHYQELRFILLHNNSIPRDYRSFLEYCTDRIFLRRVGAGYIFIHRMLMEHFAAMWEEKNAKEKA